MKLQANLWLSIALCSLIWTLAFSIINHILVFNQYVNLNVFTAIAALTFEPSSGLTAFAILLTLILIGQHILKTNNHKLTYITVSIALTLLPIDIWTAQTFNLYYFITAYFPFIAFSIYTLGRKTHSLWKQIFNWKLWTIPYLTILLYGIINLNNPFPLFEWSWIAFLEWWTLGYLLLTLYQIKGKSPEIAFVLSFYAIKLASTIYEAPFSLSTFSTLSLLSFPFLFTMFQYFNVSKIRITLKTLLLAMLPIIILYVSYFWLDNNGFSWTIRLFMYPTFILCAYLS